MKDDQTGSYALREALAAIRGMKKTEATGGGRFLFALPPEATPERHRRMVLEWMTGKTQK